MRSRIRYRKNYYAQSPDCGKILSTCANIVIDRLIVENMKYVKLCRNYFSDEKIPF